MRIQNNWLFRHNDNWLRHRVYKKLIQEHGDLFSTSRNEYLNITKHYLSDKKRWWLVMFGVAAILVLAGLLNKGPLGFIKISSETVKLIIDQRTSNIATIISITLVVVGFLINNLAIKEPYAYQLLFKHSFLYTVIYLTLSTIGCLMMLSLLRDYIPMVNLMDMVIAGTYLVLIILFCIGLLFTTILRFANTKEIQDLLHSELMIEAKMELKSILIKKYSQIEFLKFMDKQGTKEYDWLEAMNLSAINVTTEEKEDSKVKRNEIVYTVKDIDLNSIGRVINLLKNGKDTVYRQQLFLGMTTSNSLDEYVWKSNSSLDSTSKRILRNSVVLTTARDKNIAVTRKYFDEKFEEWVKEGKTKNVQFVLDSYIELYKMELENKVK